MKRFSVLVIVGALSVAGAAQAAVVKSTAHAHNGGGFGSPGALIGSIISGDLLESAVGSDSASPTTWHGATPGGERFPTLTDGSGPVSNLTGLLNDFQGPTIGTAANELDYFSYSLAAPSNLTEIRITGGNFGGDGRIFITFLAEYSTDNGSNWTGFGANNGYFESDPLGSVNVAGSAANISGEQFNPYEETQVTLTDNAGFLASAVTDVRFLFFNVDNTQGQYRDPYDTGVVNPFTGINDGFNQPVTGSLIWEIDVLPEPTSLAILGVGALGLLRRRR